MSKIEVVDLLILEDWEERVLEMLVFANEVYIRTDRRVVMVRTNIEEKGEEDVS